MCSWLALRPVNPCRRHRLQHLQKWLSVIDRTYAVEDDHALVAATDRHGRISFASSTSRTCPLPSKVVPA